MVPADNLQKVAQCLREAEGVITFKFVQEPLPANWTELTNEQGEIIYVNKHLALASHHHPLALGTITRCMDQPKASST